MNRLTPFAYFEPHTVREATEVLVREGSRACPLAGGTDLLVRRKRGDTSSTALVNLKRIPGLRGIEAEGGGLRIGALTSIAELENSPVVRSNYLLLAEAAGILASPSIRNLGTIGGNIGRASPASDLAPSLIALNARVLAEGMDGGKEWLVEGFFRGPGTTVLSPGEVITSFVVPEPLPGTGGAYERLGRREGMDCALAGVAAFVTLANNDTEIKQARIALASVAPIPLRARRTEEVLLSGSFSQQRLHQAATAAARECMPISDLRSSSTYRSEMVQVLVRRAVEKALARARRNWS